MSGKPEDISAETVEAVLQAIANVNERDGAAPLDFYRSQPREYKLYLSNLNEQVSAAIIALLASGDVVIRSDVQELVAFAECEKAVRGGMQEGVATTLLKHGWNGKVASIGSFLASKCDEALLPFTTKPSEAKS